MVVAMPAPADSCPMCGTALEAVVLSSTDGRSVEMRSCGHCDRRTWIVDGELVDPTHIFAR